MLDKAIVRWYTSHDYELPAALDANILSVMGLRDIDLSKFTYTKLADNKFRLVAALSGKTEKSINSDRDLPLKPAADVPSSSGSNSSTPSTGDTGNIGDSGNSGTTTPDTGNTGDSGNSGGTSGGSGDSGTTPDTGNTGDSGNSGGSSGNVGGSDAPNEFGLSCMESGGNPCTDETTIDFGEDGAEYIVTLYHCLPGMLNKDEPDTVSCLLKFSGKVTFLLDKDGSVALYNKTTNEYLLGYNGFSHSSYWVEFVKKS